MREIKFRAWDKKKNEMLYKGVCDERSDSFDYEATYLSLSLDGMLEGQCDDDGGKNGLHEHSVDIKDRFELMQFTGLHDKNGKGIYEGDVIRDSSGDAAPVEYMRTKEARYEADGIGGNLLSFTETGVEVIGNIYENPELLGHE